MKKKILTILLCSVLVVGITGCGSKNDKTSDESNTSNKSSGQKEKVKIPTAEYGYLAKNNYDISVYVPNEYTTNSANGLMGVYNYYYEAKGDNSQVSICSYDANEYKTPVDYFVDRFNVKASEVKKEIINDKEWYVLNYSYYGMSYSYSYAILKDDSIYEVKIIINNEGEIAKKAIKMLKDTLFYK